MHLRVAAAQLNTVVGDLSGNVVRCLEALRAAESAGADLCVMPELAITGYPPEDLLLKPGFVADNQEALAELVAASGECVGIIGFVADAAADSAQPVIGANNAGFPVLSNAAAICAGGRLLGVVGKRRLPNYGVFDEMRWFVPETGPPKLFEIAGVAVGVTICEDIWSEDGPGLALSEAGADLIVNLNASPYARGRREERLSMLKQRVDRYRCAIAYVNQIGGQDELVFDGASLVLGTDGTLLGAGRQFEEDLVLVDVPIERPEVRKTSTAEGTVNVSAAPRAQRLLALSTAQTEHAAQALDPLAEVYASLVLGTRDYLGKNGFTDAIVGLSGGIDSSLVVTVAADAIGPERVHALAMPSRYSSEGSLTDAALLAERLGIDLQVVPIESAHLALSRLLEGPLGAHPEGLTDENLQSRVRGVILMAVSNATGAIVLTTGNKSEMATGYSTLYGDSAGGFAVIKDVSKTLVYELCAYRNSGGAADGSPGPIPQSVLDKPPSAELRPDQRDDQSLPPYDELDPVLEAYVERDRTAPELVAEGYDPAVVDRVVALVDGSEYKRRQMPPGVRISPKAFGRDRRMPITNRYRARPQSPGEENTHG